ncbi:MAG: hypothetical protein ABIM99_04585 [Candidatus Dojkabacteria bacterium]
MDIGDKDRLTQAQFFDDISAQDRWITSILKRHIQEGIDAKVIELHSVINEASGAEEWVIYLHEITKYEDVKLDFDQMSQMGIDEGQAWNIFLKYKDLI